MAKDKFVDNSLVKIRDKLSSEINSGENTEDTPPQDEQRDVKVSSHRAGKEKDTKESSAIANERDWKKAVFKRWDEFKAVKKDIVNRLSERIASLPKEIDEMEVHTQELKQAGEKFQKLLDEINTLDDSHWNRHNFTSELSTGIRKLENARIEFMMQASKTSAPKSNGSKIREAAAPSVSIIHELNSLSFKQCFRIGFAFFMPLILGMLLAALIWGLIYYLSLN